jgi:NDP-sugar pyrophosphorylase family protein
VHLEAGARLGPYAVLYEGCKVGRDATVSSSILWSECFVGHGATVHESILGLEVVVEPGATVEPGSVLGRDERVHAKTS